MEFFRITRDIPFMRYARTFNVISVITFLIAVVSLATQGLNLGVDFTGGTVMEVAYKQTADLGKVRESVARIGFTEALVQNFGTSRDVLIRLPVKPGLTSAKLSDLVMQELRKDDAAVEMRRVEFVGPQVGKELFESGALALLFVSIGIVLYLWLRFEWKFGVAAIVANLHDVVIIVGFFSIFQWEFSLPVLAAVLAILGYSVNESVVVFDRVRETFRNRRMRSLSVPQILDHAITRTMSRTIITHFSTQLMVCAMLIFGGEALFYFALALTIGILFGIYSSVLVASPIVMYLGISREDLARPEPERKPGDSGAVRLRRRVPVELLGTFVDVVLNLDRHLQWLVANYGVWIYAILFAIIFCETGLVLTPFLPGDSLLFVAGTVAAAGNMYVHGLFAALATASFLGDNTNYWIGRYVGPRMFTRKDSRFLNPAHLERTQRFYDRYGAKTVFLARFVPILRTFVPFVAGMGRMQYRQFLFYSFSGSIVWVGSLTYAGYYFGNVPVVKQNLMLVIAVIILLSITPGIVEDPRHRYR